jgi:hypothetical protein
MAREVQASSLLQLSNWLKRISFAFSTSSSQMLGLPERGSGVFCAVAVTAIVLKSWMSLEIGIFVSLIGQQFLVSVLTNFSYVIGNTAFVRTSLEHFNYTSSWLGRRT